ncbi:MAG TPA: tetratricopeptide repeat protein [Candidatus Limnocylindrales bacterium]|nr:tetratricopeptide repeat protein [Candidatus Limnocylindrales bacterium]
MLNLRFPGRIDPYLCSSCLPAAGRFICGFKVLPLALALLTALPLATQASQAAPSARRPEIQNHFQRAAEDLKQNDPQTAAKEFRAVLALDPKNAEAQAMLGICEKRLGKPDAESLLENSFRHLKDPDLRARAGMELGTLYFQRGDLEHAASVAQALVDLNPDNIDILYFAQLVYSELSDDTLNKLTIIAPGSARMQQVIAEHLVNAGDLPGAITHYKKCLEMDPHLPGVRFELAEAMLQSSPSDPAAQSEAENEIQTAIKEEGDTARIEDALARIALTRGDQQASFDHYRRALVLNSADVDAEVGVGRYLASEGKTDEAVKLFRMAIEADPLNGEAHYRLGMLYRKMQMPEAAAKEIKLFQEIKQAKDRLQEIYREMNKRPPRNDEQIPDSQEEK